MEKRAVLFFVISILIFMGYVLFFMPQPAEEEEKEEAPQAQQAQQQQQQAAGGAEVPAQGAAEDGVDGENGEHAPQIPLVKPVYTDEIKPSDELFTVSTDVYTFEFNPVGAGVNSLVMNEYEAAFYTEGKLALLQSDENSDYLSFYSTLINMNLAEEVVYQTDSAVYDHTVVENEDGSKDVVFTLTLDNGLDITKTYRLKAAAYDFAIEMTFNSHGKDISFQYQLNGPAKMSFETKDKSDVEWLLERSDNGKGVFERQHRGDALGDIAKVASTSEVLRLRGFSAVDRRFDGVGNYLYWAGLHNKYFMSFIKPGEDTSISVAGVASQVTAKEGEGYNAPGPMFMFVFSDTAALDKDTPEVSYTYTIFTGPKEEETAEAYSEINKVYGYGWTSFITKPILWLLNVFYFLFRNYGLAIIFLALLIDVLLYPLLYKQQRHMYKMQELRPKMLEIQEKHKNDRQKMAEEQMKLYKEHGTNPLGCLGPMIIRLVILISLFPILRTSIHLRMAPFVLWINDLSQPDTLMTIFGFPINILPLLMVAAMVLQQKFNPQPKSQDPQMQKQAKVMMFLPIIFGFIFYNFASGLVLYWLTGTIFYIVANKIITKRLKAEGLIADQSEKAS